MSAPFTVLSIDGGGIRGIIPAMVLTEIEKRCYKRIAELFDLIAGTSTGGILALGMTKPDKDGRLQFTATEAIRLYEREGKRIFPQSIWHKVRSVGSIFEERYPHTGIEQVLEEYFGDAKLSDALTDVLISSYEIEGRRPFFFKSWRAQDPERSPADSRYYDYAMKDVARATSAAPTYFEPFRLETGETIGHYTLIDGGVFANNPALCAYAEACRICRELDQGDADVVLVSLGTGELTRRIAYDDAKEWGVAQWAQPLLNVVFDGVSDAVHYQLQELLPRKDGQRRYYRFQVTLQVGSDDLDDASSTNIYVLKLLADQLIRANDEMFEELCHQLTERLAQRVEVSTPLS